MTCWLHLLFMQMISINCNSSNELFKNPIIYFNAHFNPLGNSTCSSPEVVLAFLLYEGSTIQNTGDQFVSCVYFNSVDFAFHPSPQTKIWSVRANFKQLYLHTYWKLDTCLYELIYSEQSILPPPKIFTIPPETPLYTHTHTYWSQIQSRTNNCSLIC